MSAIPKLYSDSACTQELAKDASQNYILTLGPETGIDGNVGETVKKQLWLKNTGDEIYQSVQLIESGDTASRVTYSKDDVAYAESLSFGNINAGSVVTFHVKVTVEANATAGRNTLSLQITGESI